MSRNSPDVYSYREIKGKRRDPLVVRQLSQTNQEFRDALQVLSGEGYSVAIRTRRRADDTTVAAFDRVKNAITDGQKGDIPLLTATAIVQGKGTLQRGKDIEEGIQDDLSTVHNGVNNMTAIVARRPESQTPSEGNEPEAVKTSRAMEAIAILNRTLQDDARVQKYAVHRLTWDIQESEASGLATTLKVGLGAIAGGLFLENVVPLLRFTGGALRSAAHSAGLFVEGQADDFIASIGNAKTERGGRKGILQILAENKPTVATMSAAGFIDAEVLPHMFDHTAQLAIPETTISNPLGIAPSVNIHTPGMVAHTPLDGIAHFGWYWPLISGLTFAFTAYAGSLTGKVSNIARSASTIRALDKEGLLPGRGGKSNTLKPGESWWLGFKENQSHPFRVGLLAGIATSTAAATLASTFGILDGAGISPFIQGIIGPLETVTAYVALNGAAESLYQGAQNLKDRVSSFLRR